LTPPPRSVVELPMRPRKALKIGEPVNPANNQPKLLSLSEFGNAIGVCSTTVRRMVRRGELKTIVFNSRLIRIPVEELDRVTSLA